MFIRLFDLSEYSKARSSTTKVNFMLIRPGVRRLKVNLVRLHSQLHCTPTSVRYARIQLNCAPKAMTVYPQDTLKPNLFSDTAPSRPPSRVGTRGNDISESPQIILQWTVLTKLISAQPRMQAIASRRTNN